MVPVLPLRLASDELTVYFQGPCAVGVKRNLNSLPLWWPFQNPGMVTELVPLVNVAVSLAGPEA